MFALHQFDSSLGIYQVKIYAMISRLACMHNPISRLWENLSSDCYELAWTERAHRLNLNLFIRFATVGPYCYCAVPGLFAMAMKVFGLIEDPGHNGCKERQDDERCYPLILG